MAPSTISDTMSPGTAPATPPATEALLPACLPAAENYMWACIGERTILTPPELDDIITMVALQVTDAAGPPTEEARDAYRRTLTAHLWSIWVITPTGPTRPQDLPHVH